VIETARLRLVPATAALARAELGDRTQFARLLGARVPEGWPPETLADALPLFLQWLEEAPEHAGWLAWYALAEDGGTTGWVLVASGGFKGPPLDNTVEIGYSVLPQYQGGGYATEMVRGLVVWAMAQTGVARVSAETEWANPASVRVLLRAGFVACGAVAEPGGARFQFMKGGMSDGT
jgi:RimJ/RimL family protein N-acetyltransferase